MIKPYSNNDFDKCLDLFIRIFNSPPWNDNWTVETVDKRLKEFTDNKRFLGYTSWQDDILTGAVFCQMKTHFSGDEIFVEELFVSGDYRRLGYGKRLMNAVEEYAKEHSFVSITLLTGTGGTAFKFYENLGFKHLDYLAFMQKHINTEVFNRIN